MMTASNLAMRQGIPCLFTIRNKYLKLFVKRVFMETCILSFSQPESSRFSSSLVEISWNHLNQSRASARAMNTSFSMETSAKSWNAWNVDAIRRPATLCIIRVWNLDSTFVRKSAWRTT